MKLNHPPTSPSPLPNRPKPLPEKKYILPCGKLRGKYTPPSGGGRIPRLINFWWIKSDALYTDLKHIQNWLIENHQKICHRWEEMSFTLRKHFREGNFPWRTIPRVFSGERGGIFPGDEWFWGLFFVRGRYILLVTYKGVSY